MSVSTDGASISGSDEHSHEGPPGGGGFTSSQRIAMAAHSAGGRVTTGDIGSVLASVGVSSPPTTVVVSAGKGEEPGGVAVAPELSSVLNTRVSRTASMAEDLVAGSLGGRLRQFSPQDVVTLNVGGQVFTTTIHTLTKESDSMLASMFSGRFPLREDTNGNVFIDREGSYFDKVLNYLRDGDLALQYPRDKTLCLALMREADYYQLRGLRSLLEQFFAEPNPEPQAGRTGVVTIGKQVTVVKTEAEKEALIAYGGPAPIVLLEVSSSSFGEKKDAIIFHHLALFDRLSAEFGHKLHFVKQIVYTGKEWKFFFGGRLLHSIFFYNQYNGKVGKFRFFFCRTFSHTTSVWLSFLATATQTTAFVSGGYAIG
jgi:BTB/POZ domain